MKAAIITGASSGLGRALAIELAKRQMNVVLFARNGVELENAARLCESAGGVALVVVGDVAKSEDCRQLIDKTLDRFGQIDLLICNAGISMWSRVEDVQDVELFERLIDVNYLGATYCTFYALPHLKKSGGMIVVISSLQGKMAVPLHAGYTASKHALHGFFESLRWELDGSGVHISMVCPSWIKGTHLRRSAQKEASKDAVSLDECCLQILRGIDRRTPQIFIPKRYRWIPMLQLFFPSLIKRIVRKKMRNQH